MFRLLIGPTPPAWRLGASCQTGIPPLQWVRGPALCYNLFPSRLRIFGPDAQAKTASQPYSLQVSPLLSSRHLKGTLSCLWTYPATGLKDTVQPDGVICGAIGFCLMRKFGSRLVCIPKVILAHLTRSYCSDTFSVDYESYRAFWTLPVHFSLQEEA